MVFSLRLWPTMKSTRQTIQANRQRYQLPCGCGGTTRGGSPNGAHLGLHSKPLDAAIGRVLASHRRSGRHGQRFWSKTQNTKKNYFKLAKLRYSEAKTSENFGTLNRPSTQLIDATSFVKMWNTTIGVKSSWTFLAIKCCHRTKIWKVIKRSRS